MLKLLLATISINALAASTQHADQSPLSMIPMLIIFIGLFYLMIIKPQNKQKQQQENMLAKLTAGDEISTTGGIVGKIESINSNLIKLKIAKNTVIIIQQEHINKLMPKGTFEE